MNFNDKDAAVLRMVIYPILFEQNPLDAVERVIELTKRDEISRRLTRAALLEAIEHGLASDVELAKLLSQPHSEQVIRDFLGEIARQLA